jgi:hypothetical protein
MAQPAKSATLDLYYHFRESRDGDIPHPNSALLIFTRAPSLTVSEDEQSSSGK